MENKNVDNRVRNIILHLFLSYHNDKIDAVEFVKKFMRLDKIYKGSMPHKEQFINLIKQYNTTSNYSEEKPKIQPEYVGKKKSNAFKRFIRMDP